ncbi:FtsX-like permease family protein [Amycolatopsis sp. 195334CR]|uniref:FtsX-like permease family protein n=1 Tax=Amycolatopsis sp. 195334CR TaxID=2814588 RepID=UPI001A8F0DD4|nr:FtsX-like permease family protein [Amycolatopsis sp. 195334CR]MBN6037437.1 FtsX-like permease family protein [Amycolatopsis sp. 195334CR]
MLRLSLSTFGEKRRLFGGALVTVALGVALVQSSLLVMGSTARGRIPEGLDPATADRVRDGFEGAATLMGMTVLLSGFLGFFIVGSTFAFTVAQRRQELALLRLVGGGRGQLYRLLLAEALLLGVTGTALGVPLGVVATWPQSWLLGGLGLVPSDFSVAWEPRVLWVSGFVGIGVSLLGVLSAARRAAAVRPLEALRDSGSVQRVMTIGRWFTGLSMVAFCAGLVVLAQRVELAGALAMSMMVAIVGAAGLSVLSPLVVPLAGRLLGLLLRRTVVGEIAEANLRDGVRRSASTAAPLIVLTGLVLGLAGTMASLAELSEQEQRRTTVGDLVVESTGAEADRIASIPGVDGVSVEVSVPIRIQADLREEGWTRTENYYDGLIVIDPAAYQEAHLIRPKAGDLAELRGDTVAVGPALVGEGIRIGDSMRAVFPDGERQLRVVAVMPETVAEGATFLLPRDAVPASVVAEAPAVSLVRLAPGAAPVNVGTVSTMDDWIAADVEKQNQDNTAFLAALMGLSGLYTAVAVVNAVVMAGAERGVEFAAARVTGLTRRQVVWMALVEAWMVTAIGLGLGCLTLAGVLVGMPVVAVPWRLLGFLAAGAFAAVGVTSVWTTWLATRPSPVSLVAARE